MTAGGRGDSIEFFKRQFAIDDQVLAELLGVALERGGDYAELYFEHRESGSIQYEEQRVKTVGGGLTQGLGIRVISGEAIGYAFTEDLSRETMRRAAATAAHISERGDRVGPVPATGSSETQFYPVIAASVDAPWLRTN